MSVCLSVQDLSRFLSLHTKNSPILLLKKLYPMRVVIKRINVNVEGDVEWDA